MAYTSVHSVTATLSYTACKFPLEFCHDIWKKKTEIKKKY